MEKYSGTHFDIVHLYTQLPADPPARPGQTTDAQYEEERAQGQTNILPGNKLSK